MSERPLREGALLALASAVCFGATTPALEHFGRGVDPIAAGALVYLGAGLFAVFMSLRRRIWQDLRGRVEAPLDRRSSPRILLMTLFGAIGAPIALFYGLQGIDAATAALLLTLEAPFTWLLARLVYREHLGRRAVLAAVFITAGGAFLAGVPHGMGSVTAGTFVALAALAWAADNTASRAVAHLDPLRVVAWKGLCGASASALAALALGARWPAAPAVGGLALAGALGIGFSLVLYLNAQRRMGAGRTASVFATAPFFGVAASLLVGARPSPLPFALAAGAVALGIALHVTERHSHRHHHAAAEHEHAHDHGDGHHDHVHDPPPAGPHSHPHSHEPVTHEHEHADDLHHGHRH